MKHTNYIFFPESYHENNNEKIEKYLSDRNISLDDTEYYVFEPDGGEYAIVKDNAIKEKDTVDKEKKDNKVFWYVLVIFFLILCFFGGYYYAQNHSKSISTYNSQENGKLQSSSYASVSKKYKYLAQISYTDQKDNKEKTYNVLCKNNVELNQIKGAYNRVDNARDVKLKLNSNTSLDSNDICGFKMLNINDSEAKSIVNSEGVTTNLPTVVNNQ